MACDIVPGGPGEEAGLRIGDVLVEADGRPISTPSQFDGSIYLHDIDRPMSLVVLRDGVRLPLQVKVLEEKHQADSLIDAADWQKNLVQPLGVIVATITPDLLASLGNLRIASGVVVVARTADPTPVELLPGDVIHAVNSSPVADIETLRDRLARHKRGDSVVLQVERRGGLEYVAFEMN